MAFQNQVTNPSNCGKTMFTLLLLMDNQKRSSAFSGTLFVPEHRENQVVSILVTWALKRDYPGQFWAYT